jgi:hypothetical protein
VPGRVRRRKAPLARRQDVPTEAQARSERDALILHERAARLGLGGVPQLSDAELARLRARQQAEDDIDLVHRRAEGT